jgi:signal transduction histidine kinase
MASSVHDMKNSLSMVINSLEEITLSCDAERFTEKDKLTQLQYEAKRLNNNLVQLLALYKMGRSQYYVNIDEFEVAEFFDDILIQHQDILDQRGITVEIECEQGLLWFFDRDLIAGIVNNIFNNSYKYTRDRIRLGARVENDYLLIQISDNGPGYPQDMLDESSRQQTGISFDSGSTGLGLYFANMVAKIHKNKDRRGYIALDNDGIEHGGRFTVYLP